MIALWVVVAALGLYAYILNGLLIADALGERGGTRGWVAVFWPLILFVMTVVTIPVIVGLIVGAPRRARR